MTPSQKLSLLLDKYEITFEMFAKKGRVPPGVRDKRSRIVSDLHNEGHTWNQMIAITGLSNGAIQRLTTAKGNTKTKQNRSANGTRTGKNWKGKKRPGQLERQWLAGNFDHLRGQKLSEDRCQTLKDSWTQERREELSKSRKLLWQSDTYRDRLLSYHRSPQERKRRSLLQAKRLQINSKKWAKGRGRYVTTTKCVGRDIFWVRSSYEAVAVRLLEEDPNVVSYEYETMFECGSSYILPDFLIHFVDKTVLVEVKADWALHMPPEHKVSRRLLLSKQLAEGNNWGFEVWTEKGHLQDALRNR